MSPACVSSKNPRLAKSPLLPVFVHCRLSGKRDGSFEMYREIAVKAITCQNDRFET